jgi:hypothetical protein
MASLGFAASIRVNSDAVLLKVNKVAYRIAWELFTSIVHLTPSPTQPGAFAKGLLANQWYPSVGTPSGEVGTDTSDTGSASLSRINEFVANGKEFLGKDGVLILSNNLPYSGRAESVGWLEAPWSGKVRPYRMVARSLIAVAATNRLIPIRIP